MNAARSERSSSAMMPELGIQRAIGHLQRGHEDDHPSAGTDDVLERLQCTHIVSDVFQNVDEQDRVEPVTRQLRCAAFFEVAGSRVKRGCVPMTS